MTDKQRCLLIDIDGTLANIDHRRKWVDPSYNEDIWKYSPNEWYYLDKCRSPATNKKWKPDWKRFNEAMSRDTPNEWCVSLILNMHFGCDVEGDYDHTIIFVSGREDIFRELTEKQIQNWIGKRDRLFIYKLFMRPKGDHRSDVEIKREIYEKHIKDHFDVVFCIDDRRKIVDLWRSLGLVCLQCADGEF